MLPVFPLFLATYFPAASAAPPSIRRSSRSSCWAVAHLLANGTFADVLLFGGFLAWAVADRIAVKRRPVVEAHEVPAALPRPANDAIAVIGGLVVYAVLILWAHRWLTGVSPLA